MANDLPELSPEAFDAAVGHLAGDQQASQKEMSPEDFEAYLQGIAPPEPPNPLQAFAGRALGGLSNVESALGNVSDYAAEKARALGVPDELVAAGQALTGREEAAQISSGARQLGEAVYPKEQQGRGGIAEKVAGTVGGMAAGIVASIANPALGAEVFGLDAGGQAYADIFSKTGSHDKAMVGLIGNAGIAALAQVAGGAGGKIGGALGKLIRADAATGGAAGKFATIAGSIGKGVLGNELAVVTQSVFSDALAEHLTGEDINILQRAVDQVKDPVNAGLGAVGGLIHGIAESKARMAAEKAGQESFEKAFPGEQKNLGEAEKVSLAEPKAESVAAPAEGAPQPTEVAKPAEAPTAAPRPAPVFNPFKHRAEKGRREAEALKTAGGEGKGYESRLADLEAHAAEMEGKRDAFARGEISATGEPVQKAAVPVDESTPKADEPQQLLYAGLPPLYKNKQPTNGQVRQAAANGLAKRGGVPENAFRAVEEASGEINAQATEARILSRRLKKAMEKTWGKKAAEGQEAQTRIQEALTDPAKMQALPGPIRQHALELRAHADRNARVMVNEGMVDTPMAQTFEENLGKHLRRQYQAHSDPEWAQKIPPDVRNRLKSLLASWAKPLEPAKITELEARAKDKNVTEMQRREAEFELGSRQALQGKTEDQIVAQMEHMLSDAKAVAENPWAAIGASKLRRKDLSAFKPRKGMPQEMRDFFGEIKSPTANYTTTILKQANIIASHRKFAAMRGEGMGKWLFEEPTIKDGVNYTAEVSAGKNPALEPLVGKKPLYTSEAIRKALFDVQPQAGGKAYRAMIATNAVLKSLKVVFSPATIAAQVPQNFATAMRVGHALDWPKYAGYALKALRGKDEAELLKLTRLGLVGESVAGAEYRDVREALRGRELSEPYKAIAKTSEVMGAAFQYPDTFAKVVGWRSETERLMKTGMSREVAEREAANIVRDTYPTFSRMHHIVQKWRKQPLLGTFMGWNSEKIRTTYRMYKLIQSELKSQNPEIRKLGMQRIGWAAAGSLAAPVGAIAVNMLSGVDQEEDKDRRRFTPVWDREKDLMWIDDHHYVNTSNIDSNAWTTDSISRLIQGDDPAAIVGDAFRENLLPFIEPSMLTKTIYGLATGQETRFLPGKGKIAETHEKDRAQILFDAVKPGALGMIDTKTFGFRKDAPEKFIGFSGIRPQRFDVRESLGYKVYGFLDDLQSAKDNEASRRKAFTELSEDAQAAVRLGVPYREVRSILDEKLGEEMIDAIMSGGYLAKKSRGAE